MIKKNLFAWFKLFFIKLHNINNPMCSKTKFKHTENHFIIILKTGIRDLKGNELSKNEMLF